MESDGFAYILVLSLLSCMISRRVVRFEGTQITWMGLVTIVGASLVLKHSICSPTAFAP